MSRTIRVLVVDDDFRVAQFHAAIVSRVPGFEVVGLSHTARDALAASAAQGPDLVLLDEYLPDRRGTEIIGELAGPAFVITAATDGPTIRHIIAAGALNVLAKPFAAGELAARLTAFGRFWSRLDGTAALDQAAIDRAFGTLHEGDRPTATLPKGRSSATAELIATTLHDAPSPMTSVAVAEAAGISRATAQRYLADLARSGKVELRLRYGSAGRPEHEYVWRRA